MDSRKDNAAMKVIGGLMMVISAVVILVGLIAGGPWFVFVMEAGAFLIIGLVMVSVAVYMSMAGLVQE